MNKLHEAFDTYKKTFETNFHSVLWAVCVNNLTSGKVACFTSCYKDQGLVLGIAIANKKGYIPTPAYFKDGVGLKEVQPILDGLNKIIFGLEPEAATQIIISSMRQSK